MKLHQLATHIEEKCPHCGHPKGDTIHLIWQCPAFAHIRFKNAPRLEQLIVEACPAYFLLGIPGAFPALPSDWFALPLPQSEFKIDGSFGLGLKSQPKKILTVPILFKIQETKLLVLIICKLLLNCCRCLASTSAQG